MRSARGASVNLTTGVLQRARLIDYRPGFITVLDRDGLEQAACEDHAGTRDQYEGLLREQAAVRHPPMRMYGPRLPGCVQVQTDPCCSGGTPWRHVAWALAAARLVSRDYRRRSFLRCSGAPYLRLRVQRSSRCQLGGRRRCKLRSWTNPAHHSPLLVAIDLRQ